MKCASVSPNSPRATATMPSCCQSSMFVFSWKRCERVALTRFLDVARANVRVALLDELRHSFERLVQRTAKRLRSCCCASSHRTEMVGGAAPPLDYLLLVSHALPQHLC
jgi:16S rRNA C1402 (ribose-2'-O) methylase RsmI